MEVNTSYLDEQEIPASSPGAANPVLGGIATAYISAERYAELLSRALTSRTDEAFWWRQILDD
jgi:hypothetical protein